MLETRLSPRERVQGPLFVCKEPPATQPIDAMYWMRHVRLRQVYQNLLSPDWMQVFVQAMRLRVYLHRI